MNLSPLSIKYFKLAVPRIKKTSNSSLVCDCPLCGDKKSRLSLTAVDDEDGVVGCWNAGCILADQSVPLVKALEMISPGLENQYKTERFKQNIDDLKTSTDLNNILNKVSGKTIEPETKVDVDIDDINTGLDMSIAPEVTIEQEPKEIKINLEIDTGLDFGTKVETHLVEPETRRTKAVIPKLFQDLLTPILEVPEACAYLRNRKIEPQENWYFCKDMFVKVLEKSYFVENFIFIPLIQNNKVKGFYTRSIYEKRFSTIILPGGEKYWCSDNFNPNEPAYIFEGIFDAISSGLDNIVSAMSADLPEEFLDTLKDPIFCLDLDKTGVKKSIEYSKKGHKTFVWPENLRQYKDMNSALEEGELNLDQQIKNNVFHGIQAQILLPMSLV